MDADVRIRNRVAWSETGLPFFMNSIFQHQGDHLVRVLKNIMIAVGLFALSVLVGGLIIASNPPTPGSGGAIPGVAWLMVSDVEPDPAVCEESPP